MGLIESIESLVDMKIGSRNMPKVIKRPLSLNELSNACENMWGKKYWKKKIKYELVHMVDQRKQTRMQARIEWPHGAVFSWRWARTHFTRQRYAQGPGSNHNLIMLYFKKFASLVNPYKGVYLSNTDKTHSGALFQRM